MMSLNVAVVGGAIAGLTAACLLARSGHAVSVFECSAGALAGRGAGIVTHPGLRAVLARCGCPADPDDLDVTVEGRRVLDREGHVAAERSLPQVLAGWGRLYHLLLAALPTGIIRSGAVLASVEHEGERVVACFEDGRRFVIDLLVGADGQYSTVRGGFLPAMRRPVRATSRGARSVDEAALSAATQDAICVHFTFCLPPGEQILGYPVSGADDGAQGSRRFNAVWYRPTPEAARAALLTDTSGIRHAPSIRPSRIATKPALGLAMLERARVVGLPFAWIAGDSVYGGDRTIRRWAEDHRIGYVLTVTSGQRLALRPVAVWFADQVDARPEDAPPVWQRLSAGEGAKGPRLYDWARVPYRGAAPGFQCALLVRRSLTDPDEMTFYLTQAPTGTPLPDSCGSPASAGRSRVTSSRPRARSGSTSTRCAPSSAGTGTSPWRCSPTPILPPCAGRLSGGVVTADLAADLLPLTVPEIRHLLAALVGLPPPDAGAVLLWSVWRRRHQQRARSAHWRRRTRMAKRPIKKRKPRKTRLSC